MWTHRNPLLLESATQWREIPFMFTFSFIGMVRRRKKIALRQLKIKIRAPC
jgi:hypothetical protein